MGRDIYDAFPAARAIFDLADKALGFALTQISFAGPADRLCQTAYAQPAIVTFCLALLAAIRQSIRPLTTHFTAGHSLGEYSALAAAGALSTHDAIQLAHRRGELMQQASNQTPGAMLAVLGLNESSLKTICQETGVFIANYNSPNQIVISGPVPNIEVAGRLARERGASKVVPLQVRGAFHTPLMTLAATKLANALDGVSWTSPSVPVIANTTTIPLDNEGDIKKELVDQLTCPVQWQKGIEAMITFGINTFVEIGPGKVLTGLIRSINPAVRTINLNNAAAVGNYITKGLAA